MRHIVLFLKNEEGATAIEYALIASLVGIVLVTALTTLGTTLSAALQVVVGDL